MLDGKITSIVASGKPQNDIGMIGVRVGGCGLNSASVPASIPDRHDRPTPWTMRLISEFVLGDLEQLLDRCSIHPIH